MVVKHCKACEEDSGLEEELCDLRKPQSFTQVISGRHGRCFYLFLYFFTYYNREENVLIGDISDLHFNRCGVECSSSLYLQLQLVEEVAAQAVQLDDCCELKIQVWISFQFFFFHFFSQQTSYFFLRCLLV